MQDALPCVCTCADRDRPGADPAVGEHLEPDAGDAADVAVGHVEDEPVRGAYHLDAGRGAHAGDALGADQVEAAVPGERAAAPAQQRKPGACEPAALVDQPAGRAAGGRWHEREREHPVGEAPAPERALDVAPQLDGDEHSERVVGGRRDRLDRDRTALGGGQTRGPDRGLVGMRDDPGGGRGCRHRRQGPHREHQRQGEPARERGVRGHLGHRSVALTDQRTRGRARFPDALMSGDRSHTHLDGTRVLVTGATSGLGAAMAGALTEAGARVMVTGRDQARAQAAAETLGPLAIGGSSTSATRARSRPASLGLAWMGGIDMLVNNAGIGIELSTPGS